MTISMVMLAIVLLLSLSCYGALAFSTPSRNLNKLLKNLPIGSDRHWSSFARNAVDGSYKSRHFGSPILYSTKSRYGLGVANQTEEFLQVESGNINPNIPIRKNRVDNDRRPTGRGRNGNNTNKYGFVYNNNEIMAEKLNSRRRRHTTRDKDRQGRQLERVEADIRRNGYSNKSNPRSYGGSKRYAHNKQRDYQDAMTLQELEQKIRGRKLSSKGGDRYASQQILIKFEAETRNKRRLENLVDELIASETHDKDGSPVSLSSLVIPRDQSNLIRLLGAKGSYSSMLKLLRHFHKGKNENGGSQNGVYAYTAAITALAQSSNPRWKSQAVGLLDEMDELSILPNTFTFTAVFLAINGGKAAVEILQRAKRYPKTVEIGVHVYNSAIHACSRQDTGNSTNGWQTALMLFRQMPRDKVKPNEQTYASLLHALAKSGQLKVALSIFDEMKNTLGIAKGSSNKVWGAALRACATAGDGKKAVDLLKDMLQEGMNPNTLHYNSVLSALAKEGSDLLALELLERIQDDSVHELFPELEIPHHVYSGSGAMPDLISINTVMSSFVSSKSYLGAKGFLNRVKRGEFKFRRGDDRAIIRPDIISYNSLLSACQDPQEAFSLIREIRLSRRNRFNQLHPTTVTYTNAIGACKRAEVPDITMAVQLLREAEIDGVKPNVFMYSAAIWTAESCGDSKRALLLMDEMKRAKCRPNAVSYDGVISTLSQAGSFLEACAVFKGMKQDGINPTRITMQNLALVSQKCDCPLNLVAKELETILSYLSPGESQSLFSGQIYDSLMRTYGKMNDFDSALRVFDSINRVNALCLSSILYVSSAVTPARWEDAIILLHSSDIVPGASNRGRIDYSALSYAAIACAKENEWEEGLNLLNIYGTAGKFGNQVISVDAINSIIAAAGRSGRPDVAIQLLNEMSSKYSAQPNERTYRSVLISCNQAEHEKRRQRKRFLRANNGKSPGFESDENDPLALFWWEAALSLFRRMKEEGLKPDMQSYSSVISACEAAGQWQRAIGVLRGMKSEENINPNLFCFNAAIAACEKGGAWLEAVELYERMQLQDSPVRPNFITMNSILIALDNAGQKEMAESIYQEAIKEKTVKPWKWTWDDESGRIRVMDLHRFSAPMSKIAVRNVIDSLLLGKPVHNDKKDLTIIVGKGKGSEDGIRVLLPEVRTLLQNEYGLESWVDEKNDGRLYIKSSDLQKFTNFNFNEEESE